MIINMSSREEIECKTIKGKPCSKCHCKEWKERGKFQVCVNCGNRVSKRSKENDFQYPTIQLQVAHEE